MDRYNDLVVYKSDAGGGDVCIFFKDINSITSVNVDLLDWRVDSAGSYIPDSEFLTLQEIGDQVRKLNLSDDDVIFVWVETAFEGQIYQTGNYPGDDSWILHGTTQGYA